jgi:hypothetical protein
MRFVPLDTVQVIAVYGMEVWHSLLYYPCRRICSICAFPCPLCFSEASGPGGLLRLLLESLFKTLGVIDVTLLAVGACPIREAVSFWPSSLFLHFPMTVRYLLRVAWCCAGMIQLATRDGDLSFADAEILEAFQPSLHLDNPVDNHSG